jgi:hypothetical protein
MAWLLLVALFACLAATEGDTSIMSQRNRNAANDLQARVNKAIAQGVEELFVEAGDYYFGNTTFLIEHAKHLAIYCDPGAATLWFWGWLGAVEVQRCDNLTLRGFTMDRNPTPYIRGSITSKGVGGTFTFRVAEDSLTTLPDYWDAGEMRWARNWAYGFTDGNMWGPWGGPCDSFNTSAMASLGHGGRDFNFTEPGNGCGEKFSVGDEFVAITWLGHHYTIGNSSHVTTQDVAIRASPYMATFEVDGHGGHAYRNVSVTPGPGRLISVNADGIHSEDVDVGPLIENCRISHLLDDYINIQTTIFLQMGSATTGINGAASITLVHPHTGDSATDGFVDKQYGTSAPLLRLAPGDKLRFYDPVTYEFLGDRVVTAHAQPLPAAANSTLGKKADRLWDALVQPPYHLSSFTKQHYKVARFRSTVYQIALSQAPPAVSSPSLAVPYMVEMEQTRAAGAVIRNSNFSHSTGFFGRFKSSDAVIEGNRFTRNGNDELEASMLPAYYEGPVGLRNVSIVSNIFGCTSKKTMDDIVALQPSAENIFIARNVVILDSDDRAR